MAKVYKAPNPLRTQAFRQLMYIVILWLTAVFGFALMDTLDLLKYYGFLLLGFVCLMSGYYGRMYTIARQGIRGEKLALKLVSKLPLDYYVFTNVKLTYEEKESETDLIVVGEKGVFLIEVKNHNGRITGREQDKRWVQHKTGSKGGIYANPFYNPTKQVKTHVFRLSQILKDEGYPYWIQGVVYFVNSQVELQVYSKQIPVLSLNDRFINYLKDFQPRHILSQKEIHIIVKAIKKQMEPTKRA